MEIQDSLEFQRRRKFLLVLPLLILPFLTMAFWSLGGGKSKSSSVKSKDVQRGFNADLPDPKFNPEEKQDKFSVYESIAKNATKSNRTIDPAYDEISLDNKAVDPNEELINQKISQINEEINRPPSTEVNYQDRKAQPSPGTESISADVERLEILMENFKRETEDDPEMDQLNAILEKILEIQYPERLNESEKSASLDLVQPTSQTAVLKQNELKIPITDLQEQEPSSAAIQATIHEDQEVVSGSVIKLRLTDSIHINGILIPRNNFVYGIASINGERLNIKIASLCHVNSILPVALSAYDLDGLEGLYVPGAITRDATKKGVNDAIQSLQLMTMDPSVSAQIAEAGIRSAKGLFSKRTREVKVYVKAGYQLLLRNSHSL